MSTLLDDAERRLAKVRLVVDRFPDATTGTLPDGRSVFVASGPFGWADRAMLVADPQGHVFALPYTVLVDGGDSGLEAWVFGRSDRYARADAVLDRLRANHPNAFNLYQRCLVSEAVHGSSTW